MMKLEFMLDSSAASTDQIIVKGKRAKRRRPSSSTAGDSPTTSTTTEEDEDMAHCLILLARGYSPPQPDPTRIYLYECKTCTRTFPSFQALGGHRASHKRPKTAADDDRKISSPPPPVNEGGKLPSSTEYNKLKNHECSICGSEFGSGQALGGHMRRHRAALTTTRICNNNTTSSSHDDEKPPRNVLALDLNLPAPPEDQFPATLQRPHLVFSAVDCHY